MPQQKIKIKKENHVFIIVYSPINCSSVIISHPWLAGKLNFVDVSFLANEHRSDVLLILISVINSVESMTIRPKLYLDLLKMERPAYK